MSVTGTADIAPIADRTSAADRLRPFAAMPAGGKYLLVLDDADHAIFNGHRLRRGPNPSDGHVRSVVASATTQFWKAYLLSDPAAVASLKARGSVAALLQPGDRLETK